MGCDGGTIPRRNELVRLKKKPEATDNKDLKLLNQWYYCHLSQQILQPPIVMCGFGFLYNKVGLIEALLNRNRFIETINHIRSLKDVKNLNVTPNPEYKPNARNEKWDNTEIAPFICPLTGMEMTGRYRFIGLWSCGCVFSERALKEVKANVCHNCQAPFCEEDVVILNGNDEDIELMKHNIMRRNTMTKKKKDNESEQSKYSTKLTDIKSRKQLVKRNIHKSSFRSKVRKASSVVEDPGPSEVYKSLFISHQSELQQNHAHWVTYNPFYN